MTAGRGRVYIFLGPPASGKGTQAKLLSERLNLPHIALGDILREAVRNGTPLGLKAKSFMDAGNLVTDELVIEIALERFKRKDTEKGFIVDGFPRTLKQAAAIEAFLKEKQLEIGGVVYINLPLEAAVTRLSGRRSCKVCAAVYHVKFNPPKAENVCDRCGGELYQRSDDKPDVIGNRFAIYEKETLPLVAHYKAGGQFIEVSGEGSVEDVRKKIFSSLSLK